MICSNVVEERGCPTHVDAVHDKTRVALRLHV